MHIVQRAPPLAHRAAAVPSYLPLVAGERAPLVAALFPAPCLDYLQAPTPRRHLIHMVVDAHAHAIAMEDPAFPRAALARDLLYARADSVAARWLGRDGVAVVRTLARIGDAAWTAHAYAALKALVAEPAAAAVLRTMPLVAPAMVEALDALPAPLRLAAIVRLLPSQIDAQLLGEAYNAVGWLDPDRRVAAIARWRRAETVERLFAMAAEDVVPADFALALPPEAETLQRIETRKALAAAGRRFQNCLATHAMAAAAGRSALFLWAGPPPAAVELDRDAIYGWRLAQARGHDNAALGAEARAALRFILREAGVWCGRSGERLTHALEERAAGMPPRAVGPEDFEEPFEW